MPVQNIECQIAKAQLGRYLQGEKMDAEVVRQLEEHVATCPHCKEELAEKRNSLLAALSQREEATHPAPEAVFREEPSPSKNLIQALQRQQQASAAKAATTEDAPQTAVASVPVKNPAFWKPIAYSVCLGVVLIGMSIVGKNGVNILGDRAADVLPTAGTASKPPATEPTNGSTSNALPLGKAATTGPAALPAATPKVVLPKLDAALPELSAIPDPTPIKAPVVAAPANTPVKAPTPRLASKPAIRNRHQTKRHVLTSRAKVRKAPKSSTPRPHGIRVYDANGNPLH